MGKITFNPQIIIKAKILTKVPNEAIQISEEIEFKFEGAIVYLNPTALQAAGMKTPITNLYGLNAHISATSSILFIEDLPYLTLAAFSNGNPTFASLKINGATEFARLNGLTINRLDGEDSNLLSVDCKIEELNIGIEANYNCINTSSRPTPLKLLEIRDSKVDSLRIFVNCKKIALQGATIRKASLEGFYSESEEIMVSQNSEVGRLYLKGNISGFHLHNSSISDLEFSNCKISNLTINSGYIERSHNCVPDAFLNPTSESWKLIMSSAQSENDSSRLANAGFNLMSGERKKIKSRWKKMGHFFIEIVCGYGFKPERTLIAAGTVLTSFGVIYFILTLNKVGLVLPKLPTGITYSSFEILLMSLYFSVITFTTVGYGDIYPLSIYAKMLAGIEALIGISLAALFIFALTRRYANTGSA